MEFFALFVDLYGNEWCNPNLHLHGHLHECLKDYGPVYSFWLFAFERFNGILGSYHTNNRNISIQLMRRFLDTKSYVPCNWPSEYREKFLPVLEKFRYQKGSLLQQSFETVNTVGVEVTELPPVRDGTFNQYELGKIQSIAKDIYPDESYEVMMLYDKTKAVMIKKVVIGSMGCRHSNSSMVLVSIANTPTLCEIQYFAKCKLVPVAPTQCGNHVTLKPQTLWVAAVKVFLDHQCKVWYGNPVQVWCTVPTTPGLKYVPVSAITSRVVFTKATVNFGTIIGEDTVYIITPLHS